MRSRALRPCASILIVLWFAAVPSGLLAQADLQAVVERLERLEQQNRELLSEVRALRAELESSKPVQQAPVEERVQVLEQRVEEQAQTKIEAAGKLPVRLTGMVLFNAFHNGRQAGGADFPTVASLEPGARTAGGSMRQSIIGLEFRGTEWAGAHMSGNINMDLFAGGGGALNQQMRLRTAIVQMEWGKTTLAAGVEKPIFAPRDPTSLAYVGVSPLTNSGNPWLWLPQLRLEQQFDFGNETGLRAQVGVMQTNEAGASVAAEFAPTLERSRPALQGRFEFHHKKLEIAPGFHASTSHVAGTSVPSRLASVDWFYSPNSKVQFTGLAYTGSNIANMGTLRQGFTIFGTRNVIPVRSRGGWAQIALLPTSRLSFHLYTGQQDDNNRDLRERGTSRNLTYAGNVMYRFGPNFLVSFERSYVRTTFLPGGLRRNTHYDLAFAYLF
jgi:uncharacterized protein (UPF0335 family)